MNTQKQLQACPSGRRADGSAFPVGTPANLPGVLFPPEEATVVALISDDCAAVERASDFKGFWVERGDLAVGQKIVMQRLRLAPSLAVVVGRDL